MATEYTDSELSELPTGTVLVFDIEVYPNYALVAFMNPENDKVVTFELSPDSSIDQDKLRWMIWRYCLVGFNSKNYDLPILTMLCYDFGIESVFEASQAIVMSDLRPRDVQEKYGIQIPNLNHIDLMEVTPLKGSLKLYGARLHCKTIRELPYDPCKHLTKQQALEVKEYCVNDLEQTKLIYKELLPHIELREAMGKEYGQDLRSHSDAQLAEAIIGNELRKLTGQFPKRSKKKIETCTYKVPEYMCFQTPQLQKALQAIATTTFAVEDGSVKIPASISDLQIVIGESNYKLGIGGLHSQEKEVCRKATEETLILDVDVASYYPRIVLNQKLFPDHLGESFLDTYNDIVTRRLAAKKAGNKSMADGLKIAANGTFGKLGNEYSFMYSPNLMLQVTVTGQLSLLMLIEALELIGFPVRSGNTDGIVIECPRQRYQELTHMVQAWERHTGFQTEETRYAAIYARDVNNYIALKDLSQESEGDKAKRLKAKLLSDRLGLKAKGTYSEVGSALNSQLSKNPESQVCKDAVFMMIAEGKPIEETIRECTDVRRFVTVRNVKGGAQDHTGSHVGKVVRYYYTRHATGALQYKTSGNLVSNSVGAKPLMELPEALPDDLGIEKYIQIANEMLFDIGYYQRAKQLDFFKT